MTGAPPAVLSLADLVAAQPGLDWTEAVAVVAELCDAILSSDPAAVHLPDPAAASIDANGTIVITWNAQRQDVAYAALLLQRLLGTSAAPAPLRLFVTRALETDTHDSVAEFAKDLAYYERPGRAALVQQAMQKGVGGRRRGFEATAAVVPQAKSADGTPAQQRSNNRIAIVMGVAVGVAAAAAFLAFRFVDVETRALPPSMTRVVAQATGAVAMVTGRIRARLGIPADAGTPAPPPETAGSDAPMVRSGAAHTARRADRSSGSPRAPSGNTPAAAPEPAQWSGLAAAPQPEPSTGSEMPIDNEVYSSQSAEVVPPRLVDAGTLPTGALNSAPTDAVEVLVDRNGQVQQVKLLTETRRMTDVMLLSAAKAWRFSPAMRDGQPVRYRLVLNLSTVTRR